MNEINFLKTEIVLCLFVFLTVLSKDLYTQQTFSRYSISSFYFSKSLLLSTDNRYVYIITLFRIFLMEGRRVYFSFIYFLITLLYNKSGLLTDQHLFFPLARFTWFLIFHVVCSQIIYNTFWKPTFIFSFPDLLFLELQKVRPGKDV